MKRFFFCILAAAVCVAGLSALEWPADTQKFLRLFGQRIGENTFEQMIHKAVCALYRAKQTGRNKVVLYDTTMDQITDCH